MIGFIHPYMLLGLVAVGLPILIHLLTRPRPRVIRYPTYYLLVESGSGRQALNRLRTWIVLILRTLAVAALVLLFAQPYLKTPGADALPGQPRRVVLLVDSSMSMRAAEGGVPIFARARAQAADVLRALEPGSSAAVIFVGAKPQSILPALSGNLASLHEGLAQAEPTLEKADPAAALALAQRMLGGRGAIYIFSDFQRTNWASVRLSGAADPGKPVSREGLSYFLRPVVGRPVDNVGFLSIEKSPGEPVEGETIELAVTVFNSTPAGRKESVKLDLEGVGQTSEVELQPYASGTATFSFSVPAAGVYPGRVTLQPDDLNDDNTRYFKLRVRRALNVLVISDSDREDTSSAAFFVATALAPSDYVSTGMRIMRRLSQEVDRTSLETADAFFLVAPTRLSGEVVDIVTRRVLDGASLVCFLDDPTAPDVLAALGGSSKGAITPPFQLVRKVSSQAPGESFGATLTTRGPLKLFGSSDQGDLSGLRFRRHYLAETVSTRKDEVLVSFPDGSPALSISPAGRGLAVFANYPVAPDGGSLAGSPLFPPMLHELMRTLRRSVETEANTPGCEWTLDVVGPDGSAASGPDKTYTVLAPDGKPLSSTVLARGRVVRLALGAVPAPGNYPVLLGGAAVDLGVVNVHPDETDTRPMNVMDLVEDNASRAATVTVLNDEGDAVSAGQPKAFWPHLAALAALFFAVEMLLLALWRRLPKRSVVHTSSPIPAPQVPQSASERTQP